MSPHERFASDVGDFVQPAGDERVLDVGTGLGALALALAPLVRDVVGVDTDTERIERARQGAPANVEFHEADGASLPFDRGEFDLVCARGVLHHVPRPELVLAEMTRVTRPGGRLFVIDQLAPMDPLRALELDHFERARHAEHSRLLSDGDLRAFFEANNLVLIRSRVERTERSLDPYFELAGCEGEEREHARRLAPSDPYTAELGWYLLRR